MTEPALPILVLTTGGTIDKEYFDALSRYQVIGSSVARLLAIGCVSHPFDVQEVLRKDSLDLTDEDRLLIRDHVRRASSARIIITHGTDTMVRTAGALRSIQGKTIVLTGALSPARFHESDAAFNLGMAFATAQLAPPGAYITMNGIVFRADSVAKNRERGRFETLPAE